MVEELLDGGRDRLQRVRLAALPLRSTEMREQNNLRALCGKLADRGQNALDAGCVPDTPVPHRHVQIDPDENALAVNIVQIIEGSVVFHGHSPADRPTR